MSSGSPTHALSAIDWSGAVASFLKEGGIDKIDACNLRLAIWSKQLEQIDKGNPALAFIREMQSSGHYVASLSALSMYKPASAAIRTMMETALYYIFFSSHPVELATLMRDKEYYVSKAEIVDYLKMHEPRFKKIQDKLGLLSRLADLYSDLSAIVHGQLPGSWTAHVGIASIKKNEAIANDVVDKFVKAEDVVHKLFLCTVAQSRWDDFSTSAKKALIKGIPGDIKILLNLDMA